MGSDKPKITDNELKDARSRMSGLSSKDRDLVEGIIKDHGSAKGVDEKGFEAGMSWLEKHGKDHGLTDSERERAAEELKKKL